MSDWVPIKANAPLTTAYADGWASGFFDVGGANRVLLELAFGTEDATSYQFLIESEDATGTQGAQAMSSASGVLTAAERSVTLAVIEALPNYDDPTGKILQSVDVVPGERIQLRAKKTGGSGGDSLRLRALPGLV